VPVQIRIRRTKPNVRTAADRPSRKPRKARDSETTISIRTAVPLASSWYLRCKTGVEFLLAAGLLILNAPVILLAALAVKLTSRGPAFYIQSRVGKNGRVFTIFKIRTMIHNCESLTGPRWAIPGDPRVTRVGQFLRSAHLDELPPLINILRGGMGLIGPRPERPEFVTELERALPCYRDRLSVRPGVTGLAQVQLPADTELASVRRKLAYDLHYIRHLSLSLDLRILFCTVLHAFGVPLRIGRRLFGIPDSSVVEGPPQPAGDRMLRRSEKVAA